MGNISVLRKTGIYLKKAVDLSINFMAMLSCILVCVLTIMICVAVLFRYFLNLSVGWSTEITEYLIYLIVMLGAPWVLKRDKHVVVDVIVNIVKPEVRRIFKIASNFFGTIAGVLLFYYGSLAFHENFLKGTLLVKVLPIPQYLPLFFVPLSAFFITFVFIEKFWIACFSYTEDEFDSNDLDGF